jgi:hypothetical protein
MAEDTRAGGKHLLLGRAESLDPRGRLLVVSISLWLDILGRLYNSKSAWLDEERLSKKDSGLFM